MLSPDLALTPGGFGDNTRVVLSLRVWCYRQIWCYSSISWCYRWGGDSLMYAVRGWHTRQWGSHAARCEKGTALAVARRLDFVGRARPTHVLSPRRHSPEAEGSLGGSSSSSMQRASSRRSAGQRLKVCGAPCVAGARGRPARRAVRANTQAARPGLRVLASASRRPARPQRPRHASRVAADSPFALPFTVLSICIKDLKYYTVSHGDSQNISFM